MLEWYSITAADSVTAAYRGRILMIDVAGTSQAVVVLGASPSINKYGRVYSLICCKIIMEYDD